MDNFCAYGGGGRRKIRTERRREKEEESREVRRREEEKVYINKWVGRRREEGRSRRAAWERLKRGVMKPQKFIGLKEAHE